MHKNSTFIYNVNQQIRPTTGKNVEANTEMDLKLLHKVFKNLDTQQAPVSDFSIRKIMDYSRSYLNVPLKTCNNTDVVLN